MCNETQCNQHAQKDDPIRNRRGGLLYPLLLRPSRHSLPPWMYNLDSYIYNLAAEVRHKNDQLPRNREREEHDCASIVRTVYDEDDKRGDSEDESKATEGKRGVEMGCERTCGRCGCEAAEESRFFTVVLFVGEGVAMAVVGKERGS